MSCLLLYAIDLWYKIHRLKELKFSTFVIMFVAFFAGQFIAIGLAFSNNKGEQPVFQSLGIGVICFYVLTPVSSNSERFLTLLPAIINIVYLALTINVVIQYVK